MVTAHYDSLNLAYQPGKWGCRGARKLRRTRIQMSMRRASPMMPAACVRNGTRPVFSQYDFDKTLVFVAFSGEEEGCWGGSLTRRKRSRTGLKIEACSTTTSSAAWWGAAAASRSTGERIQRRSAGIHPREQRLAISRGRQRMCVPCKSSSFSVRTGGAAATILRFAGRFRACASRRRGGLRASTNGTDTSIHFCPIIALVTRLNGRRRPRGLRAHRPRVLR